MRTKQGFTLIEIMIVIVIIGIAVTFAVISFGDFGKSRQARSTAEQLAQYIALLQQKAILENCLLGITIQQRSYQAKKYVPSKGWLPVSNGSVYTEQPLPNGLQFSSQNRAHEPVGIIIQTSGDISPFTLYISGTDKNKLIRINSKTNGGVGIDTQT